MKETLVSFDLDEMNEEELAKLIDEVCEIENKLIDILNGQKTAAGINALLRCVARIVETIPEDDGKFEILANFAFGVMAFIKLNREKEKLQ